MTAVSGSWPAPADPRCPGKDRLSRREDWKATSASAPPCLVVQAVERGAAAPAPHQER